MLYAVGTHIDLRHLNGKQESVAIEPKRESTLYYPGTVIQYIRTASGAVVRKITEPSIALHVRVVA